MSDDFANDISTTGSLTVNEAQTAETNQVGDQDWFAVSLVAGTKYRIDATPSVPFTQGGADTHIAGIYDASGTLVPGTTNFSGGLGRDARVWFEPTQSGTYYVSAGLADGVAPRSDTTYQIVVRDDWDDYPADSTTTATVEVDGEPFASGSIDEDDEVDWIAVNLTGGRAYTFNMQGGESTRFVDGASLPLDVLIEGIYDANSVRVVDAVSGAGSAATARFLPQTGGVYYIAAASEGEARNGNFSLEVTGEAIGTLGINQTGFGAINETGDQDFFNVVLVAGEEYRIDVTGLNDSHIGGLYDPNGNFIAGTENYSGGIGRDARLWFTATEDGVHTVAVGVSPGYGSANNQRYEVRVQSEWDDIPDTVAGAAAAELGVAFAGTVDDDDDVDWIGVALEAGSTYRIAIDGDDSTRSEGGRPLKVDVKLDGVYDTNGALVGNAASGSDNTVNAIFKPDTSGTYYVAVTSEGAARNGGYNVVVTQETDVRLGINQTAFGTVDAAGDQDLFTVQLTGGTQYRIDATGIFDAHIGGIFGPDGNFINGTVNYSGGIGRDARLWFMPEEDGLYTVSAGVSPGASGDIGRRYELVVRDSWDDSAEDPSGAAAVEVGVPFDGSIDENNDVDWIGVALETDTLYSIDLRGGNSTRSEGGRPIPVDVLIEGIYDAQGDRVADGTSGTETSAQMNFAPAAPGTYFVAVTSEGVARDGLYQLTVSDALIARPEIGETVQTSFLRQQGQQEFVGVELTAGTLYRIDATGSRDAHIGGVYDALGTQIAGTENFNGGIGKDARVWFTPEETGVYYVSAGASPELTLFSRVNITIADQYDDFPDDVTTTALITEPGNAFQGATVAAEIDENGDVDWIGFDVLAGERYDLAIIGRDSTLSDEDGPIQTALAFGGIFDADGNQVMAATGETGTAFDIGFAPDTDGRYYVAVSAADQSTTGAYAVTLYKDQVAGDVSSDVVLNSSYSFNRVESDGDQDWFTFSVRDGQPYLVNLAPGTPAQIEGIYDAGGTLVDGVTIDGQVAQFTASTDQDLWAAVVGPDSGAGASYNIRVTNDEFSDQISGVIGAVEVNGSATGTVNFAGDRDWFAVELEEGVRYRIDLEGSITGRGTLSDAYFRGIYNAEGSYIGFANDDSGWGRNSQTFFTAPETGTYFLSAGAWSSRTGTYSLFVTDFFDDYSQGRGGPGLLTAGASLTGDIFLPNDQDWIALETEVGATYQVTVTPGGDAGSTLVNPRMEIWQNDLTLVANTSGSGPAQISLQFEAEVEGPHYVAVLGNNQEGSYTVSMTQLVDLIGTAGNDWLFLVAPDAQGIGSIDGGDGIDMMSFGGLSSGIIVNVGTGVVSSNGAAIPFSLTMNSIENVTGTSYDDIFRGGDGSEKMRGLGGRDLFYGSAGDRDTIDGGTSVDTLDYSDSEDSVMVSLFRGRGWTGDAAGDRISNIENVIGTLGDDMIWGDNENNRIEGRHGDDTITGAGGDDYILAGIGTDVIVFSGNQDEYRISTEGIRTEVEHLNDGADGFDVIGHAEILRFADGDFLI